MIFPDTHSNKPSRGCQQEISGKLETISGRYAAILPAGVPKRETLQDWIRRRDAEMKGTQIDGRDAGHPALEARAKRRGHSISAGYLDNLASGKASNPSARLMKALAAAYAVPLREIVNLVFDLSEGGETTDIARELIAKYESLSPAKQREKQSLLEMVIRELQR